MNTTATQINCPHCGQSIDVSEVLRHQLEEQIRGENEEKLQSARKKLKTLQDSLTQRDESLQQREETLHEAIKNGVNQKIEEEKKEIEKRIRSEVSSGIEALEKELNFKSKQVMELNNTKAALAKANREKDEAESRIRAEIEQEKSNEIKEARKSIKSEVEKLFELQLREKDLVIEQMNEQVKEAQKRAEQGSMQRQGEVQELAIEEFLRSEFPLDTIEEVKKGDRGADSLQIVNTRTKANCGCIYYESKRTKEFKTSWLAKFKADMRSRGAMFGMLITDAMPKAVDRMTQLEGIWVCSFDEFKALCHVLRQWVITISEIRIAQESKGDKMTLLYDFLTGPEFRGYMEAIVESFVQMKSDLESEKRSMQNIWKKRERQIEKVQTNTIDMHAAIKAIAGNAIGTIKLLELPEGGETSGKAIEIGEQNEN